MFKFLKISSIAIVGLAIISILLSLTVGDSKSAAKALPMLFGSIIVAILSSRKDHVAIVCFAIAFIFVPTTVYKLVFPNLGIEFTMWGDFLMSILLIVLVLFAKDGKVSGDRR